MKKLSTAIIIIGFILGVGLLGNYYRESHKIVSPEIVCLNADTMDIFTSNWIEKMENKDDMELIKNWIQKQENLNKMVLGKVTGQNKVEEYYLYISNIKITDVGISPHNYDGIKIQVTQSDNAIPKSLIFKIKPTDKKLKYILFNGNKFEVSKISIIN